VSQKALLLCQGRLLETPQGLGPKPGHPVGGNVHQRRQGDPQPVVPLEVLYRVQRRQPHVQVFEPDRPQLPEVFLINIGPDPLQAHLQVQPDGQHRQAVLLPQVGVVVEHARPKRRHLVRRLDLDMHQGQPVVRLAGALPGHLLARRHLGDQIQRPAAALRRVGKDFLVQPLDRGAVQALGPGRKNSRRKSAKNTWISVLKRWS
jgi:hypothetical protein